MVVLSSLAAATAVLLMDEHLQLGFVAQVKRVVFLLLFFKLESVSLSEKQFEGSSEAVE